MSKYLIHNPNLGVLCKPPRAGMNTFWEQPHAICQLRFPAIVGVMLFDSFESAQLTAALSSGTAKPVTDIFDRAVILATP